MSSIGEFSFGLLVITTLSSTVRFLACPLPNKKIETNSKDLLQAKDLYKMTPQNELSFAQNELARWGLALMAGLATPLTHP